MCLTVTHIPRTWRDGLLVDCCKWMERKARGLRTPYWCVAPQCGWLFADWNIVDPAFWPRKGSDIRGEGVHAYRSVRWVDYVKYYPAVMFGVFAIEVNNPGRHEICGRACWIPEACDDRNRRDETNRVIGRLRWRKGRTTETITDALRPVMSDRGWRRFVSVMEDY
jgi:hypothetical protein